MSSYIKVRKEVARTFYNKGFDIRIIPCKVSEQVLYDKNTLISPVIINKKNMYTLLKNIRGEQL